MATYFDRTIQSSSSFKNELKYIVIFIFFEIIYINLCVVINIFKNVERR